MKERYSEREREREERERERERGRRDAGIEGGETEREIDTPRGRN